MIFEGVIGSRRKGGGAKRGEQGEDLGGERRGALGTYKWHANRVFVHIHSWQLVCTKVLWGLWRKDSVWQAPCHDASHKLYEKHKQESLLLSHCPDYLRSMTKLNSKAKSAPWVTRLCLWTWPHVTESMRKTVRTPYFLSHLTMESIDFQWRLMVVNEYMPGRSWCFF